MRVAFAALAWLFPALLSAAAPWTVDTLFEMLARERPNRAVFKETRHLALLDRPLESTGELLFTPPARLEKRTLAPKAESVVVDRDRVMLERNGKRRTVTLAEQPAIAVLVESIRATLAGDLGTLRRSYSVGLEGTAERWKLVLRPLAPEIAPLVSRVEIGGSQGEVRTVEVLQADGDRSVMTIAPLR